MNRKRPERTIALIALVIAIIGLSVGFAAMSTTLQIQGTAEMNPASWNIRFNNLSTPTITGYATVTTPPVLTDTAIGPFVINLTRPSDSVQYTFDIVNSGSIDALLGTLTETDPVCVGTGDNAVADAALVCNNLTYTFTYTAGANITLGDLLAAGQTRNVTLRLAFTGTELPENSVSINGLGKTLVYVQD